MATAHRFNLFNFLCGHLCGLAAWRLVGTGSLGPGEQLLDADIKVFILVEWHRCVFDCYLSPLVSPTVLLLPEIYERRMHFTAIRFKFQLRFKWNLIFDYFHSGCHRQGDGEPQASHWIRFKPLATLKKMQVSVALNLWALDWIGFLQIWIESDGFDWNSSALNWLGSVCYGIWLCLLDLDRIGSVESVDWI